MNRRILLVMASVMMIATSPAIAYFPSLDRLEQACVVSGGEWQKLPKYCDKMHPRSWHKLSYEQQQICQDRFNEPCECGIAKRFSVHKIIGCIKSLFPEDLKPERY